MPRASNAATFSDSVASPRQAGMLDHVVEREQAPHEYGGRGVAAVADVLGSDGPVDPPGEDAAHAADPPDAGHGLLGRQAPGDQGRGPPAALVLGVHRGTERTGRG